MTKPVFFSDMLIEQKKILAQLPPFIAQNPMTMYAISQDFGKQLLQDQIYFNRDMTLLSVIELEGLKTWTQWLAENFPGYKFDPESETLKPETAPTVSYSELRKFLLSKDWTEEQEKEFEERYKKWGPVLLDGKDEVQRVALSTFHRSGNTLTRKYFEFITGIATGSIMNTQSAANLSLCPMGFLAERIYDDRTWMYKTHLPTMEGFSVIDPNGYLMSKAVVVVRNPIDSAYSLFQMMLTNAHTLTVENKMEEFPALGDLAVKNASNLITSCFKFWVNTFFFI